MFRSFYLLITNTIKKAMSRRSDDKTSCSFNWTSKFKAFTRAATLVDRQKLGNCERVQITACWQEGRCRKCGRSRVRELRAMESAVFKGKD